MPGGKGGKAAAHAALATSKFINFSHQTKPFGFLSNFYPATLNIEGITYPSVEHYFQAMKFQSSFSDFEEARNSATCADAKAIGGDRYRSLRPDWEEVKDLIMLIGVYHKFATHNKMKAELLGTGERTLVEHTRRDSYWGDGGDGSGKNMLGITLMRVRAMLRDEVPLEAVLKESGLPPTCWAPPVLKGKTALPAGSSTATCTCTCSSGSSQSGGGLVPVHTGTASASLSGNQAAPASANICVQAPPQQQGQGPHASCSAGSAVGERSKDPQTHQQKKKERLQ